MPKCVDDCREKKSLFCLCFRLSAFPVSLHVRAMVSNNHVIKDLGSTVCQIQEYSHRKNNLQKVNKLQSLHRSLQLYVRQPASTMIYLCEYQI